MKFNITTLLMLFILLPSLFGCSENQMSQEEKPYFPFLEGDSDRFIAGWETGEMVIYKNQNNEALIFEVLKSEIDKEAHIESGWLPGSITYFHYDEQNIVMESTALAGGNDVSHNIEYSLKRWPQEFTDGSSGEPMVISEESKFVGIISILPFRNSQQNVAIDFSQALTSLNINGVNYNEVRIIELEPQSLPENQYPVPLITNLYYSQNNGIIGFDDVNDKEWRLQL